MIGGSGGIQFQPSEFSKILMILFTATFLDKLKEDNKINTLKGLCLFVLLIGLSLALIAVEPDLSTTLCLAMVLVTMLYLSGLSYKIIGIALLVFVPLAGSFLWYIQRPNQHLLRDYQVNRILQFIYPGQYGSDYTQQNNSVMAIGSGQLTGKGLNTSTIATVKDANFISEQQTDFIFSVIGEELGFVGSVIIIAILLLIVLQCIHVARNAKDTKGMLIAAGMGCLIAYQTFINVGVATGVIPNTGIDLAKIVSKYSGVIKLHVVPFTDVQLAIYDNCPHDELTIIMKRIMYQIAQEIALKEDCQCLITGESIGQVSSQTTQSLLVIDSAIDKLPVFRPCIGMDKQEIIDISEKIGTYETSILPYEDCCTTFVAQHPVTKPKMEQILESEKALVGKIEPLIAKAVEDVEIVYCR